MELKAFKMASGEVIVGYITGRDDETLTVENPVHVHIQPQMDPVKPQNITMHMMMLPAIPFSSDKSICLNRFHVVAELSVSDDLSTQYRAQFAGLTLPTPSLLV